MKRSDYWVLIALFGVVTCGAVLTTAMLLRSDDLSDGAKLVCAVVTIPSMALCLYTMLTLWGELDQMRR